MNYVCTYRNLTYMRESETLSIGEIQREKVNMWCVWLRCSELRMGQDAVGLQGRKIIHRMIRADVQ